MGYFYNQNGQKNKVAIAREDVARNVERYVERPSRENFKSGSGSDSDSKKSMWLWVGVALAVILVLLAVFMWLRGRSGSSTASMGMKRGAQRWGFRFY
jgi:hypothetical protein